MREAGFEPAHPEITRLKLVAFTARPFAQNMKKILLLTGLEPVTSGS